MNVSHALFIAALLLYTAGAGLYHVRFLTRNGGAVPAHIATALGWIAHTIAIGIRTLELGHAPYVQFSEAVSTMAWVIVLLTLAIEFRKQMSALGAFSMPIVVLVMFLADTLPSSNGYSPILAGLSDNPLKSHIGALVTAFGAFALSFCAALLYLLQERRLKRKQMPSHANEPSLAEVESLALSLAAFGFSLLSLGLVLGVVTAWQGAWKGQWLFQPIVLTTFATWLMYAVLLFRRGVLGKRGRQTVYYLLVGFVIAAATLLFVRAAFPGQHRF